MKKYLLLSFCLCLFHLFVCSAFAQNTSLKDVREKMMKNDFAGAISILNTIVERNPNSVAAYEMRANIRSMKGDVKGSIEDFTKLIDLQPTNGDHYFKRARFRTFVQDFQGAIKDYDLALERGISADKVYTDRALVKYILKDFDGSLKDYQMAVSIRPHLVPANLGYARILVAKNDSEGAINYLEGFLNRIENDWANQFPTTKVKPLSQTALSASPMSDGNSVVVRGQAVMVKDNTPLMSREEAEKQAAQTEQLLNLANAYEELASLYENKNELNKAVININKAFSLVEGNRSFSFYSTHGKIRIKLKDYDNAVNDFTVSIRGIPFDASNYLNRGITYFLMGKEPEAQKDFDVYLQKYPKGKESLDKRIEEARKLKGS